MKKRVFIAINLPGEIQQKLSFYQDEINNSFFSFGDNFRPIRWTKKENLHITLAFLGYLEENRVNDVKDILSRISQEFSPFVVKLSEICYAPQGEEIPRMIWAIGDKSEYFSRLKEELDKELQKRISFHSEKRVFLPHVTLGRIRKWQWKMIGPDERPKIEKDISLKFEANSIDLMESKLTPSGPKYTALNLFPCKK